MSGLAVLHNPDGRPIARESLRAMLDAVPYRATEGVSTWTEGAVGLGYAKMTVTAEDERDQQPLVSPRTGCVLIADVRVDNRDEIIRALPDTAPSGISDSDLILRAYDAWGVRSFEQLLGDFAVVIWDPRRVAMILARDTSGQRPLFYRSTGRAFAAASEIHQLFADDSVPIAPNRERLLDYLVPTNMYRNQKEQPDTFYEGISVVPSGHVIVVTPGGVRSQRYWEPNPNREVRCSSPREYGDGFREVFFDSVRSRLRSIHPVGVLLSGGLDSTSVACCAQEIYRRGEAEDRGFTSFSVVFPGLECDEESLIRDTQAKYGFSARLVPASGLVHSLDPAPTRFMAQPGKAASELDCLLGDVNEVGARAILSGDVGDSCVYGSPLVFDSLFRQGELSEALRRMKHYHRTSQDTWRKIVALYGVAPLLPPTLQRLVMEAYVRRDARRVGTESLPTWMPRALQEDLSRRDLELAVREERERRFASPARESIARMLYPPEVGHDIVGRPMQIVRPFTDRRVHEYVLSIPPEHLFNPRPDTDDDYAAAKQLIRRGLEGVLPESVRTRLKTTHFASLFEEEVRREWGTYEHVFGPNGHSAAAQSGLIDSAKFWDRLNYLRIGFWGSDFLYITRVIWVETWLRTFTLARSEQVRVQAARIEESRLSARGTVLVG